MRLTLQLYLAVALIVGCIVVQGLVAHEEFGVLADEVGSTTTDIRRFLLASDAVEKVSDLRAQLEQDAALGRADGRAANQALVEVLRHDLQGLSELAATPDEAHFAQQTLEQLATAEPAMAQLYDALRDAPATAGFQAILAGEALSGPSEGLQQLAIEQKQVVATRIDRLAEALARPARVMWVAGAVVIGIALTVMAVVSRSGAHVEQQVAARTRDLSRRNDDMRRIMDNAGQGFLTLDAEGRVQPEWSAVLAEWFGAPDARQPLGDYLGAADPRFGPWFTLAFEAMQEGMLPLDVTMAQLPVRLTHGARTFSLTYRLVDEVDDTAVGMVVIVTDITAQLDAERAERAQRQLAAVHQRISADPVAAQAFVAEADGIVQAIESPEPEPATTLRLVHTLKGNSAMYGLETLTSICHEVESRLVDAPSPLEPDELEQIRTQWAEARELLTSLMPDMGLDVSEHDIEQLMDRIRQGAEPEDLEALVRSWTHESVDRRLHHLADQARALASRLDKPQLDITVTGGGLRLPADRWSGFWASLVHVIRNAVDHGVESAEARRAAGKPPHAQLALQVRAHARRIVVEVRDDGPGIDWDRVRARAAELGLPDDPVQALFSDGLSTREHTTAVSGRGVGTAAVWAEVMAMGGTVQVESEPGDGTCFRFAFPLAEELAA
jgi:HPt (histidine-containing phosphotransfer) domain-containing protein